MTPAMFQPGRLSRGAGPLYRQAAAQLRTAIVEGRIDVGADLPTEADLAQGLGVSLITVRHALRDLAAEGLIRKRTAKAAAVISRVAVATIAQPLNSLADVIAVTDGAQLRIAGYGRRLSDEAAAAFGLDGTVELYCLRGRMFRDGDPISEVTIFFPPEIGARLTRGDFDDVVVFRSVEKRLGIKLSGARITVSAELADAALARSLKTQAGTPVLVNRMLWHAADGRPVELTIARHRADRYRLRYDVS